MPTMCDGRIRSLGKANPVALVKTVVARNSAVQPCSLLESNMPTSTINPERMPIRLKTT
jgi:hypothetical protein